MNWIDLLILIILFAFTMDGIRRGFLVQTFNILGFFTSLLVGLAAYAPIGSLLLKFFNIPQIAANPIGFLLVWIVTESLFFRLSTPLVAKFIGRFHSLKLNKFLGIVPAIANGVLFLAFVLLFIVSMPLQANIKKSVFDSKIGSPLVAWAIDLEKPFNDVFGPLTKQTLTFLTVKPQDKETINLNFTQENITVDRESEQKMFNLVNQERQKVGAKLLIWDENLARVARDHSKDMFARGYFSHYSPEGKDVGDRLTMAGISYAYAGENLALAPNIDRAHTGLMNSPDHKKNILDPAFNKIGIGIVNGGIYGEMFTQVFTN